MSQSSLDTKTDSAAKKPVHFLSEQIKEIAALDLADLRAVWSAEFRTALPPEFSRDLLVRTLAWQIQEGVRGGHDKTIVKLLRGLAQGRAIDPLFRRLKSGTVLIREYQGVRHTVTVTKDGFIWQEQTYTSLSVIARAIAGTNWNGPRFFGLRVGSRKDLKSAERDA